MISGAPGWRWATSTSSGPNASGSPRPAWIRMGTCACSASSKIGSTCPVRPNAWARGCSLMPRAPAARQRSASAMRIVHRIEPAEGDEAAVALRRPAQHPVVGQPVGRRRARGRAAGTPPPCRPRPRRAARPARPGRATCRPRPCPGGCGRRRPAHPAGRSLPQLVLDRSERARGQQVRAAHHSGSRASIAAVSVSRTSSEPIRSSTGWKKPRTISCSASRRDSPRAIR